MIFSLKKLLNSCVKKKCFTIDMLNFIHIKLSSCCYNKSTMNSTTKKLSFIQNIKLFYFTILFNEENDSLMTIETALQPFMGTMNNLVRYFGKIFVIIVWVLSLNMLNVFYTIILPQIYSEEIFLVFLINFVYGTWMAVNTFFHYTMGWLTNPGEPFQVLFKCFSTLKSKSLI